MQNFTFCLCISGNLGYIVLEKLFNKKILITCVLTDSLSYRIIEYCENNSIKCFKANPRGLNASKWLNERTIYFDYLLSVNYLYILENDILNRARLSVNFHGSLLPKYRGRTPHVWAIINGEKECGITAHLMNEKCDDGDIIKQIRVKIDDEDTGATILEKYNKLYPLLVEEIITIIHSGNIFYVKQDRSKATYYGKRTPEDGGINWEWQKNRIRNWVRAQAKPYPGAFSHIENTKIIIHNISYSDLGYSDTTPNGYILNIIDGKPVVKTPNGAIIIQDFEFNGFFKVGQILKTI